MSSHVPCDIQEEIMKRLPAKSLIRFRSVCKAWKSLIKSSEFIADYSIRHTQPQHLLISYKIRDRQKKETKEKQASFVDDDTFPKQKFAPTVPRLLKTLDANRLTIIGGSHGLLCYCYRGRQKDMAVLWNPFIRKAIGVVIPNLVKEPFSGVLGFGVCPHTGDPKLVKVTYISTWCRTENISCIPWQVMVLSLSSKKWTIPCNSLPRKSIAFTWSCTVIGQFIYWLALDWSAEDGVLQYHNLVLSFDMTTEEFREVHLPDSLVPLPYRSLSISRVRDSLALVEYTKDITGKQVTGLWMMKHGDPKLFTKLYTIKPPRAPSIQRTLGFRKSGEPIIDREVDGCCSRLFVYEPLSEHLKDLGILANLGSISVNSYTESLLLLNEEDDRQYLPSLD